MAKDLQAVSSSLSYRIAPHASLDPSQNWKEEMWSRSDFSLLFDAIFAAVRLKKKAVAGSIGATLRPTKLSLNGSNRTLIHLAIGDVVRIGICLDIRRREGYLVNQAEAVGNCSLSQALARSRSVVLRAWFRAACPRGRRRGPPG